MRIYDFDKIQKDYLTAALKAVKNGTSCPWIFAHCDADKTTIISDHYFMAIIPDDLVYVASKQTMHTDALLRNIQPDYSLDVAEDTGLRKTIDKNTVCIFKVKNEEIWINEKYIKYFAGMDYDLRGTTKKQPLQVYVNDKCIGLILPINHN